MQGDAERQPDKPNKRVRLLLWKLYYQTRLQTRIDERIERQVAQKCKLCWEEDCSLKERHPELWRLWATKRAKAQSTGRFPDQPHQLWRWRKIRAPQRAKLRKERPRFTEWAAKKLIRQRTYKAAWKRSMVLNRLTLRVMGR